MDNLVAVVLAAGEGTRMVSSIPKVLHHICGKPMISHVIDCIREVGVDELYFVTGFKEPEIKNALKQSGKCITQKERLGTAHAVMQTLSYLRQHKGDVLIMCGDTPLIKPSTIEKAVKKRRAHHLAGTVLTTKMTDPSGYGRVVRNRDMTVRKIVEEKDTNIYEAEIKEINTGTYCFSISDLLKALPLVNNENAQQEYYLTDVIEILCSKNREIEAVLTDESQEAIGINSREELARAEKCMRMRILDEIMRQGVTVLSPDTTFVDKTAVIGRDSIIYPFSIIEGNTVIGQRCRIGPSAHVVDSVLGDNVVVQRSTVDQSTIEEKTHVPPFSYYAGGKNYSSHKELIYNNIGDNS